MDMDSARGLKSKLIAKLYDGEIQNGNFGLRSEALPVREDAGEQVGIGYSRGETAGDCHLEIRLGRPTGRGAQVADEIRDESPSEVHVAVIDSLWLPSPERLMQSASADKRAAVFAKECRPLHPGLSIGHVNGGSGSIGAFVSARRPCPSFPRGGSAILSACHVLALQPDGGFASNVDVYQPGRQDIDTTGVHKVGTMFNHYTTFSRFGSNYADAAYAMITREKTDELLPSRPNQIPQALGFPVSGILQSNPLTSDELNFKHPMAKVGRTTGFTCGFVSGFGIDEVTIHVHGVGNVRFDNLLEIEWDADDKPFAKDGDSGSLVFDPVSLRPVGLHFAGGFLEREGRRVGVSYACSLEYVLKLFELQLL